MTTKRSETVSEKPGFRQQAATVITVSPGTPEQVAALTSACSTAGGAAAAPVPDDPATMNRHRTMQPGRALAPIADVPHAAGSLPSAAGDARLLSVRPATSGSGAAPEITPLRMFQAFRRCWPWAVGLGFLAAVVTVVAAWFLVPSAKYTAESVLQVYSRPPVVAFSTAETANEPAEEYKRYQKTQIALLKSRFVLLSVLQKPEIARLRTVREAADPVQWLKDHLDVSFLSESEILQIALKGDYPEDLAILVNAITDAYMEEVVNVERRRRTERYDMLKELNAKKLKTLAGQREHVRKLAESLGSNNQQALVLKQQLAAENQAFLDKELLQIRSEKRKAEAELNARLRLVETVAQAPVAADDDEIEALLDQEPSVAALQQQLDDAEHALNQHLGLLNKTARNPGADPAINQLRLGVRRAQAELKRRRFALRPTVLKRFLSQAGNKGEDSVTDLRRRLEVMDDLEKQIEAERQQLSAQARTVNTQNLDLQSIQDEIEQAQTAASKMGGEIQSLEIELQAPRRVKKIEEAEVPITSNILKRYMTIAMATLGAFLACAFGMTFWELQSQKVSSATEIVSGLGLALIGTLPVLPVRARRGGLERTRSQDVLLERLMYESIDVTRTMLLNATRSQTGQVVAITSAMGGEGKTSLSCHLASSLARSGRKTLLLDADLRNPSINRLFDQPLDPGLSEVLRGELAIDEAIVASSVADLDLIPAGQSDRETMRNLSQGGVVPLLDRLRERYDCVIIDTAPVLPITDTLLIAPHADAVILAVLTDVSRAHKVSEAHQRLLAIGASVLGAVFTGDRANVYGSDYRYRYVRDNSEAQPVEPTTIADETVADSSALVS